MAKKCITSPMTVNVGGKYPSSGGPHMGLKMDSKPTAAFDVRSVWKAPKGKKQDFTSPMADLTIKPKRG